MSTWKRPLICLLAFVTLAAWTFAGEAPAPDAAAAVEAAVEAGTAAASVVAPAASGESAGYLASNFEAIVTLIGAILALILGADKFSKYRTKLDKIRETKTWEIAKSAVVDTYHTYTGAIKKAREDGKLTAEEAAAARKKTTDKMKEIAKTEGVKLIKSQLPSLVELAVNFMKKKAKEAKS